MPVRPHDRLRAVSGVLRSGNLQPHVHLETPEQAAFVTLSRQPGTIDPGFAEHLAQRLGERDQAPWTVADRQVAERVAEDLGLSERQIDRPLPWLTEVLSGMRLAPGRAALTNMSIYHRVVAVIRALAEQGRVVIVGRGGVFITSHLPHGVHVRFVAPRPWRLERLARRLDLSRGEAEREIDRRDDERQQFFMEWWAQAIDQPDHFALIINLAQVGEEHAAQLIADLVHARQRELRHAATTA